MNNVGICEFAPIEAVTPEHFHKQFDLKVLSFLLTTQEAINLIGPEGSSIINISSVVGQMPAATGSVYSVTTAAVFFAGGDSGWVTGQTLLVADGIRQ